MLYVSNHNKKKKIFIRRVSYEHIHSHVLYSVYVRAPVKLKLYRKPSGSAFLPVCQIHVPSLLDVTQTSHTQSTHGWTHCLLSHTCFSSFIPNISITVLSVTQSKNMGSVFDFSSTQSCIYFIMKNWFDLLTPHRSASFLHIFQYYCSFQLVCFVFFPLFTMSSDCPEMQIRTYAFHVWKTKIRMAAAATTVIPV